MSSSITQKRLFKKLEKYSLSTSQIGRSNMVYKWVQSGNWSLIRSFKVRYVRNKKNWPKQVKMTSFSGKRPNPVLSYLSSSCLKKWLKRWKIRWALGSVQLDLISKCWTLQFTYPNNMKSHTPLTTYHCGTAALCKEMRYS